MTCKRGTERAFKIWDQVIGRLAAMDSTPSNQIRGKGKKVVDHLSVFTLFYPITVLQYIFYRVVSDFLFFIKNLTFFKNII